MNPQLTLTMIYFLQELRRPIKHDVARLRELEDEMVANLIKATFILGIETVNDEENTDPIKVNMKNIRIPFMKSKESIRTSPSSGNMPAQTPRRCGCQA